MALFILPPPQLNPLSSSSKNSSHTDSTHTPTASQPSQHFPIEGMEMLYLAENRHFWHRSRVEFIYEQVSRTMSNLWGEAAKQKAILDVGAGTGAITRYFLKQGFHSMALGEIHPQGLEYAKTYGISKLYCMDLLDIPFVDEFDCIFAFDVIEHLADDRAAIMNMKKMLKNRPKSLLAISVPAHQWLWNAHDEAVHHKRRYTKSQLVKLLESCGLHIESSQYFFIAITPLLLLRAWLSPGKKKPTKVAHTLSQNAPQMQSPLPSSPHEMKQTGDRATDKTMQEATQEAIEAEKPLRDVPPPGILNTLLLWICRLENQCLKRLPKRLLQYITPFGGSLLVIATIKMQDKSI